MGRVFGVLLYGNTARPSLVSSQSFPRPEASIAITEEFGPLDDTTKDARLRLETRRELGQGLSRFRDANRKVSVREFSVWSRGSLRSESRPGESS